MPLNLLTLSLESAVRRKFPVSIPGSYGVEKSFHSGAAEQIAKDLLGSSVLTATHASPLYLFTDPLGKRFQFTAEDYSERGLPRTRRYIR